MGDISSNATYFWESDLLVTGDLNLGDSDSNSDSELRVWYPIQIYRFIYFCKRMICFVFFCLDQRHWFISILVNYREYFSILIININNTLHVCCHNISFLSCLSSFIYIDQFVNRFIKKINQNSDETKEK